MAAAADGLARGDGSVAGEDGKQIVLRSTFHPPVEFCWRKILFNCLAGSICSSSRASKRQGKPMEAIAVGFSIFIRLAKEAALPSCGVADAMMSVSERRESRSASLARGRGSTAEGDIVGFVDDDDVPVAFVRPNPELGVLFKVSMEMMALSK